MKSRQSIRLKNYDYSRPGNYFVTICCHKRQHRFGHIHNKKMHYNAFGKIAHQEWQDLPKRFPNITLGAFQIMPNHMHGIINILCPVRAGLAPAQSAPAQSAPAQSAPAHPNPKSHPHIHSTIDDRRQGQALPATDSFNQSTDGFDHSNPHSNDHLDSHSISPIQSPARSDSFNHLIISNQNPHLGDVVGAYKSLVFKKCLDICKSNNLRLGKLWQRNYYESIIRGERGIYYVSRYILNNVSKWNK